MNWKETPNGYELTGYPFFRSDVEKEHEKYDMLLQIKSACEKILKSSTLEEICKNPKVSCHITTWRENHKNKSKDLSGGIYYWINGKLLSSFTYNGPSNCYAVKISATNNDLGYVYVCAIAIKIIRRHANRFLREFEKYNK